MADFRLIPALLAAIALAIPGAVKAFPAAPLEADTRPCFELLPDPAITRHCFRHYRHGYGYEWAWGYRIFCERARPGAVSWAIEHLPPGARLILVGGARPCLGTLHITRPIEIIGEPGWLNGARVPTLQPFEGQPCVVVEPGRGPVVLKNLLIQSKHGEESCIIQRGRELTLDNTWVRYDGHRSAVQVDDGRFIARQSVIAARTEQPGVVASGAVEMEATSILATTIGLVIHPTEDSRLRGVNVERLDDWSGSQRVQASVGMAFDSAGTGRLTQVEGAMVEGFSRGVYADGGQELQLQNLVVRDSEYGVLSDGSRLRVNGSEIEAVDAGIYAASGEAWAGGNRIFGVRRAGLFVEKGKARLYARDNEVFADKDGCQALAVEGLDPEAQSCRPWFQAPEFYRTGRVSGRPSFDDVWPDSSGSLSTRPNPGY